MKVVYDVNADTLRIVFKDAPVEDFSQDQPGVTLDYDVDDRLIGLEIQQASQLIEGLRSTESIRLERI